MINYIVGDGRDVIAKLADGSVDLVASSPPFFALRSYLQDEHDDKHNEMGSELTPADYLDNLLEVTALWARVLAPHGSIAIELGDTYAGSGGAGGDYNEGGMRDGQAAFDGSAARGRRKDHDESGRLPRQRVKPKTGSRTGTVDAAPPDRLRTRRQLPGFAQAKSMMLIPQLYAIALAYGVNPLTGKKSPAGSWLVRNVIVWHRPNPAVGALGDKVRPSTSYIVVATKSDKRWYDLTAARLPAQDYSPRNGAHVRDGIPGRQDQVSNAADNSGHRIMANAAGAPPLDCWFDEWDGTDDTWTMTTTPSQLAHYAMWPAKLAERIVLMMCPPEVCRVCGEPRRRIEERTHTANRNTNGPQSMARRHLVGGSAGFKVRADTSIETLGWTECSCEDIERLATPDEVDDGCELGIAYDSRYRPGLVLDPFCGTGTTLCVAELHARDSIGIDLDPRNRLLLEPRMAEVKRSLHGVKPEMPGQLSLI